MHADYAVVDLETTGGNKYSDDIIEIAIVLVNHTTLTITDTYHTLIRGRSNTNPAQWVNHISPRDLRDAPTFNQVAPTIKALLAGRLIVGHNLKSFDLPFLNAALARYDGTQLPKEAALDTLHLARKHLGLPRNRLGDLVEHYSLVNPMAHSALGDTIVTAQALIGLLREEHIAQDAHSRTSMLCPTCEDPIDLTAWLPRNLRGNPFAAHTAYPTDTPFTVTSAPEPF